MSTSLDNRGHGVLWGERSLGGEGLTSQLGGRDLGQASRPAGGRQGPREQGLAQTLGRSEDTKSQLLETLRVLNRPQFGLHGGQCLLSRSWEGHAPWQPARGLSPGGSSLSRNHGRPCFPRKRSPGVSGAGPTAHTPRAAQPASHAAHGPSWAEDSRHQSFLGQQQWGCSPRPPAVGTRWHQKGFPPDEDGTGQESRGSTSRTIHHDSDPPPCRGAFLPPATAPSPGFGRSLPAKTTACCSGAEWTSRPDARSTLRPSRRAGEHQTSRVSVPSGLCRRVSTGPPVLRPPHPCNRVHGTGRFPGETIPTHLPLRKHWSPAVENN